jgi:hypothetical protein
MRTSGHTSNSSPDDTGEGGRKTGFGPISKATFFVRSVSSLASCSRTDVGTPKDGGSQERTKP